ESVEHSDGKIVINVGDLSGKAEYAKLLEHGSGKMQARPFLMPLVHKYFWLLKQKLLQGLKQ
ncbi:MAG TPA: hypothetical protein VMW66_02210, partial [Elusimicrobiales bacterium]|nr:hypothetical protein [Elusimicrobiales bacterium]